MTFVDIIRVTKQKIIPMLLLLVCGLLTIQGATAYHDVFVYDYDEIGDIAKVGRRGYMYSQLHPAYYANNGFHDNYDVLGEYGRIGAVNRLRPVYLPSTYHGSELEVLSGSDHIQSRYYNGYGVRSYPSRFGFGFEVPHASFGHGYVVATDGEVVKLGGVDALGRAEVTLGQGFSVFY